MQDCFAANQKKQIASGSAAEYSKNEVAIQPALFQFKPQQLLSVQFSVLTSRME